MQFILVVVRPFGAHATGDRIEDPAEIRTVLAGEHAHCVVKIQVRGA